MKMGLLSFSAIRNSAASLALLFLLTQPATERALAAFNSSEYFPLVPGSKWTYTVSGSATSANFTRTVASSPTTLHSTSAYAVVEKDSGAVVDVGWWSISSGIRFHRSQDTEASNSAGYAYESPLVYVPASADTNQTYTFAAGVDEIPMGGGSPSEYYGNVQGSTQVGGLETITTPAGTFQAIRITSTENWYYFGQLEGSRSMTWWLAKTVGIVKYESTGQVWQMVAYSELATTTPPIITAQPTGKEVATGDSVTLLVTATGTEPLNYQWYKGETAIAGANASTYTITSFTSTDAADYTVKVSNSAGSITSSIATLTLKKPAPPFKILSATFGTPRQLRLSFQSQPGQSYTIQSSSNLLVWTDLASLSAAAETSDFQEDSVQPAASRYFRIKLGATQTGKPLITEHPTNQTVYRGGAIRLSVAAQGVDLQYQWKKDGVTLAGRTSSTLLITNAAPTDAGVYIVEVINSSGATSSNPATVTVPDQAPLATLPIPNALYDQGTTFGGQLFGAEFTIPPGWQGGLRENSPFMVFSSTAHAGIAMLEVLGFAGTKDEIMADPSIRGGFAFDAPPLGNLQFRPTDAANPVKFTAPDRLTAEYGAQTQDQAGNLIIVSCVLEIIVHPSKGMIAFFAFGTQEKLDDMRGQAAAFATTVKTSPRQTDTQLMSMLHGRYFKWNSGGSDWYHNSVGYNPGSASLSSWSESFAYFCSEGTFEISTTSETIASTTSTSGGFLGISGKSTTREFGQWTVAAVPGYGDIMMMVTSKGYNFVPVQVDAAGTLYVSDQVMSQAGFFNCGQ